MQLLAEQHRAAVMYVIDWRGYLSIITAITGHRGNLGIYESVDLLRRGEIRETVTLAR